MEATTFESRSRALSKASSKAKGYFFLAAGLSFLLSVFLFFTGDKLNGVFVGLWVPSILSAGNLLIGGRRHE